MNHETVRRLSLGLSRELWLVVTGIFLNSLGYGAILPFEVIYLHDERGFSLSVAGLVVAMLSGVAVVVSPLAGPLIDRFGARATAACAGLALAAGYGGLAFAATPELAFASAVLAGIGNGALNPSQSTLVAVLTGTNVRHRATAVSRVAANAGYGIGGALGGLVAMNGLNGYVALCLINAVTYVVYAAILVVVVREAARPQRMTGGYRVVLRDHAFMHLALTNLAIIGVGWGVFTWLVPPFAKDELALGEPLIGSLLLANAATVVLAQLPIARFAEGRRRAVIMALGATLFAGACLLVIAASVNPAVAYVAMIVAAIAVGVGECLHTTVLMPLTAELAPEHLRGRYMASMGLSWWMGLALAPALGTPVLSVSPAAAFFIAGAVAAAAALSALTLERRLPETSRLTPRPI
jgi:MFS family permease